MHSSIRIFSFSTVGFNSADWQFRLIPFVPNRHGSGALKMSTKDTKHFLGRIRIHNTYACTHCFFCSMIFNPASKTLFSFNKPSIKHVSCWASGVHVSLLKWVTNQVTRFVGLWSLMGLLIFGTSWYLQRYSWSNRHLLNGCSRSLDCWSDDLLLIAELRHVFFHQAPQFFGEMGNAFVVNQ